MWRFKTVSEYKRDVYPQCNALSPSVLSRSKLFSLGKVGGARSRSSRCSGKEESSCSAGEFVEETTTCTSYLCEAGKVC